MAIQVSLWPRKCCHTIFVLSPWTFYNCPPIALWDNIQISTEYLSIVVTLKIRSMSSKLYELFVMSQWNVHANVVIIHTHNHKLACSQAFSCHIQYGSLSHAVTLKMRSMSQKSNKLFSCPNKMSMTTFYDNLISILYDISQTSTVLLKMTV